MPNQPPEAARTALVDALRSGRGDDRVNAEAAASGDSGSTLRCEIDGVAVAARWHAGSDGQEQAERLAARTSYVAQAGIATPAPARIIAVDDPIGAWSVCPWHEGKLGSRLLGDPAAAELLAAMMGARSAQLSALPIPPTETQPLRSASLALDARWASQPALAAAATRWTAIVGEGLDRPTRLGIAGSIELLASPAHVWQPTLTHGDFVPINVIVGSDNELVLLDLEHMTVGPPSLDPAWWSWVVRFHHPEVWVATWPTFIAAAGLSGEAASPEYLSAIGRVRALQRAAEVPNGTAREAWIERLTLTAAW